MALLLYLPEIVAFGILFLMATQVTAFGPLLVLLELGLMGLVVALRAPDALKTALRWWPLLLSPPLLAAISTVWSEVPMATFRYGIQFLATAYIGILLARLMTPRRLLTVFLVAFFVFCIACILYGRQGGSINGNVLIGLTGSKNQMGYAAQILLLAAMAVLLLRDTPAWLRWIAILSMPIGLFILLRVDSATALLMGVGGTVALLGLWFAQRMTAGGRLGVLVCLAIMIAPLLLLIPEGISAWEHFLYDTLDKDPTLTGRTFLWARADDLIAQRPLLGHGYQSIWMGDSIETIALQRMTGLEDLRQFHFHHQYRQIAVDTGYVGLIAFIGALVFVFFAGMRQLLLHPSVPTSFFFILFLLMVTRTFTDVIVAPLNVHTVIFYVACTFAFWRPQEAAQQTTPAFSWRRLRPARIPG